MKNSKGVNNNNNNNQHTKYRMNNTKNSNDHLGNSDYRKITDIEKWYVLTPPFCKLTNINIGNIS